MKAAATVRTVPISKLVLDDQNANVGTKRGRALLEQSLKKYGAGRSVLIDKNNRVIAGNKTVEQARANGMKSIQVIETDGSSLVAVQRGDLDLKKHRAAKELAIADNRVSELDLEWNAEVLANMDADLSQFWSEEELHELLFQTDSKTSSVSLAERFGVPPFSVLDARQGYWQERKRAWLALGIESEIGRGGGA